MTRPARTVKHDGGGGRLCGEAEAVMLAGDVLAGDDDQVKLLEDSLQLLVRPQLQCPPSCQPPGQLDAADPQERRAGPGGPQPELLSGLDPS